MESVTHVIFDLDGLLLDTEVRFEQCYSTIAVQYGKQHTWAIQEKIMGKPAVEGFETIINELELPITVEEFKSKTRKLCTQILPDSKLLPGADRLVRHLHSHKVPLAVATSSSNFSCQLKMQKHLKFFDLFDHIISAVEEPEVKRAKPFPDVFLVCASKFSNPPLNPHKVLVFEDSPAGVEAAVAAGMPVVMIPDRRLDQSFTLKATIVLKSLEDFNLASFGLPPYD